MTSMFRSKEDFDFNFCKRIQFVPKGFSPIFVENKKIDYTLSPASKKSLHKTILENYENELNTIKWSNYICNYNDVKAFFEELYKQKSRNIENVIPDVSKNKNFPSTMIKLCNNLYSESFTKNVFNELETIGQLDNKFICTYLMRKKIIVLFDQHAVHERARLEKLLADYVIINDDSITIKSTKYSNRIVINLLESDISFLKNYKGYFEKLGLSYKIVQNAVEITGIPTCIYNKFHKYGKQRDEVYLKNVLMVLIDDQIRSISTTRGVPVKMPTILQNIINSEACRGAIKFGDELTIKECRAHINWLSNCKAPFQCAHGRPVLAPIIHLQEISEIKDMKPNLRNLTMTVR